MNSRLTQVYEILSRDDQFDRVCADIPDSDCSNLPGNFILSLLNGAASKLAEQVSSAKLVIPWLLGAMGTPAFFIGWLLPLRQAGTLIPQLAVSGQIRRFAVRKWFWVGSAVVQALSLGGMVFSAALLAPSTAGWAILACLLIFSVARGVGSIAFQDVTGKTIPRGRRGKLLAARSLTGGVLTIGVGLLLGADALPDGGHDTALLLLTFGAILWLAAAAAFASVKEAPGAVAGGRNALGEARAGWRLIRRESWYVRFIAARTLLLSVELAGPFYVLHVQGAILGRPGAIGIVVLAAGVAAACSSPVWGRYADVSSRKVLVYSGFMGAATAALALVPVPGAAPWVAPLLAGGVFVLLGFSESGVLLGRKTYLMDHVGDIDRPTYVAFTNSIMGLVVLVFGSMGVMAQVLGTQWMVGLFLVMGLAGGVLSLTLPEVSAGTATAKKLLAPAPAYVKRQP